MKRPKAQKAIFRPASELSVGHAVRVGGVNGETWRVTEVSRVVASTFASFAFVSAGTDGVEPASREHSGKYDDTTFFAVLA